MGRKHLQPWYDLDECNIVAVRHFNMGAMENKSLNIFNSKLVLADAELRPMESWKVESRLLLNTFIIERESHYVSRLVSVVFKEGLTVFVIKLHC